MTHLSRDPSKKGFIDMQELVRSAIVITRAGKHRGMSVCPSLVAVLLDDLELSSVRKAHCDEFMYIMNSHRVGEMSTAYIGRVT